MIYLLLDSSDKNLSVGLSKDGNVFDSISYEAWQKQSEFMIQEIKRLMDRNNLTKDDLAGVVSSRGPGSYTGVRISLSIAKTISFALQIPLYLVSSLECFRQKDKPTICLMNARSKRSYFAVYKGKDAIIEDKILTNEEVFAYINEHKDYLISGDVAYLSLTGEQYDVLSILSDSVDEKHLIKDSLSAKPVYLKDTYLV